MLAQLAPKADPSYPTLELCHWLPAEGIARVTPPFPPNNGAAGKALNLGKAAFLRRQSQCSLVWIASDIIPPPSRLTDLD